jgi:hypothetical protein
MLFPSEPSGRSVSDQDVGTVRAEPPMGEGAG